MSTQKKLITLCFATVFTLGLAACGSSGDNDMAMDEPTSTMPMEPMEPTADEQLATLRGEIAELRKQLGIEDGADLGDSISDLQDEVAMLMKQVDDAAEAEAAAAAKAHMAKLNKLAMGIGPVGETLDAHVRPDTTKPDTATDGDAPYAISGWNGASYSAAGIVRDTTTMTVVYNNKEPATPVTFSKRWAAAMVNGTYTFAEGTSGKYVSMEGLPTHVSHDGAPVDHRIGVRGMFNGVSGKFTSDADIQDLTVGVDGKGVPSWDGNLNFVPDSATATVMKADDAYMSLGWWLNEAADGTLDPMVAAWATGGMYVATDKLAALEGEATFQGIAVGKYTHKTVNDITGGHFNADAKLVADWGDATDPGTLTGTIDGFMQDGQPIGSGWKVELGAESAIPVGGTVAVFDPKMGAEIMLTGAVEDTENGAMGTFGTQKTMGTWNANLVDDSRVDGMPGGVTGTFHVGETGHPINMIGAFAASNQEADQPAN